VIIGGESNRILLNHDCVIIGGHGLELSEHHSFAIEIHNGFIMYTPTNKTLKIKSSLNDITLTNISLDDSPMVINGLNILEEINSIRKALSEKDVETIKKTGIKILENFDLKLEFKDV